MILSSARQYFQEKLTALYGKEEVDAIFFALLQERFHVSRIEFEMNRNKDFENLDAIWDDLDELISGVPLQYVVGRAPFYGMSLRVTSGVLIPRPETEELVSIVLDDINNLPKNVLDIGTGSGCIALALAKNKPGWNVFGLDVSEKALVIARENAQENNTLVQWVLADIQNYNASIPFDIIVSNPPYIPLDELENIEPHVKNYEPHIALFAPANDALFFYRIIKDFANKHLTKPGGRIYFETHYNLAREVAKLFEGEAVTSVINDMFGKPRFVVITY